MSYTPISWKNDNSTPYKADNLNHMEDGISNSICCDGDIILGNLILKGDPTEDNEASTKSYIEKYINRHTNSLTDYTWRDYEFTIPAHSSTETSSKSNNNFDGITFYTPKIEGKFSKIILWKINGLNFLEGGSFFVENCKGVIISFDDLSDNEIKVFYLDGAKVNYNYRFAIKRVGDSISFTYKITENSWRYSTSEATLYFTVI